MLKIAIRMVRDASKSWNATLPNKSYETYTLLLQKIGGIALILFYYHDTDSVIPWSDGDEFVFNYYYSTFQKQKKTTIQEYLRYFLSHKKKNMKIFKSLISYFIGLYSFYMCL